MNIVTQVAKFGSYVLFAIAYFTTRKALLVFAVGTVAGLALALYAYARSEIETIEQVIPGQMLALYGHLAPDNTLLIVTLVFSVQIACFIYNYVSTVIFKFAQL